MNFQCEKTQSTAIASSAAVSVDSNNLRLGVAFGDVNVVDACAVKAQINPVLVRLVTEVATEWLLTRVSTEMALEVV